MKAVIQTFIHIDRPQHNAPIDLQDTCQIEQAPVAETLEQGPFAPFEMAEIIGRVEISYHAKFPLRT